jgi:hypothetical protein
LPLAGASTSLDKQGGKVPAAKRGIAAE